MKTLTVTLQSLPGTPPQHPPYLAQTGSVCLEGIQLVQDSMGQLGCVFWTPGSQT